MGFSCISIAVSKSPGTTENLDNLVEPPYHKSPEHNEFVGLKAPNIVVVWKVVRRSDVEAECSCFRIVNAAKISRAEAAAL